MSNHYIMWTLSDFVKIIKKNTQKRKKKTKPKNNFTFVPISTVNL